MPENMTPNESPEYRRLYKEYTEARDLCTALTLQFGIGSMQAEDAEIKMRDLWRKLTELGGEPAQWQA
jgi:hypothetical protein